MKKSSSYILLFSLTATTLLAGCSVTPEKEICTAEVDEVCAAKQVQCVTQPCDPVEQTYTNLCEAKNDGATVVHPGACKPAREKARDELLSKVTIDSPQAGEIIDNPLEVTGSAPGNWFFEATAPVRVTNSMGIIIGEGFIQAQGDRMTEDIVAFSGTIDYTLQGFMPSKQATLILVSGNASGEKAFEAEKTISVEFR